MQWRFVFSIFIFSIVLFSCKKEIKKSELNKKKNTIKYAKGFDIESFDSYNKLIIKSPFPKATTAHEFYLIPKDQKVPEELPATKIIRTPLEKLIVTSTTHIPMLEALNAEKRLIGFPNLQYISSHRTIERIREGKIKEIGKEENLNTEVVLSLQPEAIIGFVMSGNSKLFENIKKANIPVVLNGDWLETSPLGRAEWLKFFGILLGEERRADSIFSHIELEYKHAKQTASEAIKESTILSGVEFNSVWNLPAGDSFVARFLKDANTNYLWNDSQGTGSLQLSFEAVFEKGQNADFWIAPGHYTSFEQLKNTNEHYSQFKAFKNKNIFTFSLRKGPNGGIVYYEKAALEPHIVLKDIIKIVHPELLLNYEPHYLEKLTD